MSKKPRTSKHVSVFGLDTPNPNLPSEGRLGLGVRHCRAWVFLAAMFLAVFDVAAEPLGIAPASSLPAVLPGAGASVFRVCGAFFVVVALFLAGVWLFRNWQRLSVQKGGGAKLSLIEVKSLGQRQVIYVVGYQQQRMLLATSPAGVTLLSHLPSAGEAEQAAPAAKLNFAEALQHVLSRRQ
jgi:flagellar biogenesis protein FliO